MLPRLLLLTLGLLISFVSFAQADADDPHKGFQTFEMENGDTTIVMKQYFMVFLKQGAKRD